MIHHNELVSIEEDTILGPRSMIRRFTLENRANHLTVSILSSGGTLSSCKLENGKQETVVSSKRDAGDAVNGLGQPVQLLSEWQSHVLGLDSLLLTTSSSQSLMYQLTTNNELHVTGKIKGHLNAMAPFFFNLVS